MDEFFYEFMVNYKKENKYLKEKKLVDDYFKIKKNITSEEILKKRKLLL